MKVFRSANGIDACAPKIPDGHGCVYLLLGKSMLKLGSTKRPFVRIAEQPRVGSKRRERVSLILLSEPFDSYQYCERLLKKAAYQFRITGEGFPWGRSGPRETFEMGILNQMIAAISACARDDATAFRVALEEIAGMASGPCLPFHKLLKAA